LIISFFFSLALIPGVEYFHQTRGWKRGAAVGVIYAVGAVAMVLMVLFLIPAVVTLAQSIGESGSEWLSNLNTWASDNFGVELGDLKPSQDATGAAADAAQDWASAAFGTVLGIASAGLGLLFNLATIALFTFYLTADHQRIQRATLSLFNPRTQQRLGWTWDQAVEQTGGYFYSRLLLMVINGFGFFFTMVMVGLPVVFAIPLAVFGGFISEFIPAVGTYIGAAIPIVITLAVQGLVPALIVLAYALIYQQIENYWLSPRLSAKTMTLNGGVAFGAALAGGAIAGPMGAFMALPIAALITAFISNYAISHEVVYHSQYEDEDEPAVPVTDNAEDSAEA